MPDLIAEAGLKLQADKLDAERDLVRIAIKLVDGPKEDETTVDADTIAWATTNAGRSLEDFRFLVDVYRERKRLLKVISEAPADLAAETRPLTEQRRAKEEAFDEATKQHEQECREINRQIDVIRQRHTNSLDAKRQLAGICGPETQAKIRNLDIQITQCGQQSGKLRDDMGMALSYKRTAASAVKAGGAVTEEMTATLDRRTQRVEQLQSQIEAIGKKIEDLQAEKAAILAGEALDPLNLKLPFTGRKPMMQAS